MAMIVMNLVTPTAAIQLQLLFNKNLRSAAALGVTKFITMTALNLITLCCVNDPKNIYSGILENLKSKPRMYKSPGCGTKAQS